MKQEPVKVAVFDLNQTVYRKSSKEGFFKFICYKKNYRLGYAFRMALYGALSELNLISKTVFKENFFQYLNGLPPEQVHKYAHQFWGVEWDEHFNKDLLERIEELREEKVKIIFITGTYDVYVGPLFDKFLPVDKWMATETYYENGTYKIKGKALKGEEKLNKLKEYFGDTPYRLLETYSDQEEALFDVAEKSYLMKKGEIVRYREK